MMLIRLAFSPLTNRASPNFGKLGMFKDPDHKTFPFTSSPKVTESRLDGRTLDNRRLLLVIGLELPLSKYHLCSILVLKEVSTIKLLIFPFST